MNISSQIKGLEKVEKVLGSLQGSQARTAYANALNDTAFQHLKPAIQNEMRAKFNRPSKFIMDSPRVVERATADKLSVSIMPTYASEMGTKGGKLGVDPQHVLQAQELGGRRADKKSEVVLRRAGILPTGCQTAVPKDPFPGSVDAFGDIRGSFIQQLLSYLQAFGEQGSKANMKAAARENLHRGGTRARLAKVAGPTLGRRYFVAYGKARGGARTTRRGEPDQRASNLPAGIWAVLGRSGAVVRPVLLFVRIPAYSPRIELDRLAETPEANEFLSRKMRFRIRQAAGL